MKVLFNSILLISLQMTATFARVYAQPTNISTNTTYTQTSNNTVTFNTDISGYFSANGLTASSPALLFPDNAVVQAYGLDPGNCQQQFGPFGPICSNYRFKCQAILPGGLSNSQLAFDLVDLNAVFLHKKDDPPGTCYLTPYTDAAGQPVLGISVIVSYESSVGVSDRIGTMGWFAVLSGGAKALIPGNCMTLSLQYNPRAGDPASFTWGDGANALQSIFQMLAVGNADEPAQVTAATCAVFETPL